MRFWTARGKAPRSSALRRHFKDRLTDHRQRKTGSRYIFLSLCHPFHTESLHHQPVALPSPEKWLLRCSISTSNDGWISCVAYARKRNAEYYNIICSRLVANVVVRLKPCNAFCARHKPICGSQKFQGRWCASYVNCIFSACPQFRSRHTRGQSWCLIVFAARAQPEECGLLAGCARDYGRTLIRIKSSSSYDPIQNRNRTVLLLSRRKRLFGWTQAFGAC